jgi:hypothetical protein
MSPRSPKEFQFTVDGVSTDSAAKWPVREVSLLKVVTSYAVAGEGTGITVSTAAALVLLPALLLTTTANWTPLWLSEVAAVVYALALAPEMSLPFRVH